METNKMTINFSIVRWSITLVAITLFLCIKCFAVVAVVPTVVEIELAHMPVIEKVEKICAPTFNDLPERYSPSEPNTQGGEGEKAVEVDND